MDITKTTLPGPSWMSQSRQGIKINQQNTPNLLALSASFLLALVLASKIIFPACFASCRLAHQPAGSVCQPKASNLGTLCLNQGCSLPALSSVVPYLNLSTLFATSRPKDRVYMMLSWWWLWGWKEKAPSQCLLDSTLCVKLIILLCTWSAVAVRISTSLLIVHLNLPWCKHSLRNCSLVKGPSFFLVFII